MGLIPAAGLEAEQGRQGVAYELTDTVAEQEAQHCEGGRADLDPMQKVWIDTRPVVANGERKPIEPPAHGAKNCAEACAEDRVEDSVH